MSDWQVTPFVDLEQALLTAERMDLKPSTIITDEEKGIRYFQVREGKRRYVMAQRIGGGPVKERRLDRGEMPPPLVDPLAPRWNDEQRLRVGPWCLTDRKTLAENEEYIRKQFVNPDNLEFHQMVLFRQGDGDEFEYMQDARGVWVRLLSRPKVLKEEDFQQD